MKNFNLKEQMKIVHRYIKRITAMIEILISIIVLAGLLVSFIPLLREVPDLISESGKFSHFLEFTFNLVIGIEFLEMLNNHSPGSALEVFLFAIVRHMVIETGSALDMLIGVLAVGLIFAIRKYVYVDTFEEDEEAEEDIRKALRARRDRIRNRYREEVRHLRHETDQASAADIPAGNRHNGQENGYDGQGFFKEDSVNPVEAETEELLADDDNE